ncbi:MAG: ribosome silencing factor [Pelagibacteraceae bacterium]|nr:ribosome silencing factor [Pelagibacteraceae bacterium]MBT4950419.1 ribosome silencing factor [Pelagibacteraceae bacterium]
MSSSFSLTDKIYSILDDAKAEDIKVIDLRKKSSVADFFVISTCRSTRHADATADEVSKQLKKLGYKNPSPEGRPKCDWVIVDADSVIVHLFRKETREIYNLEQLWETNFESEKSKLAN